MRQPGSARTAEAATPRRAACMCWTRFSILKAPTSFRFALALALSALLAACAAQSPPVPPRVEHPQPVRNLTVEQVGQALQLSFTLPALATDGKSLTKPLEVEIFRATGKPGQKPLAGVFPPKPWIALSAEQVRKLSSGRNFSDLVPLSSTELQTLLNSKLQFSVVTLTRGFRHRPRLSAPSNIVATEVLDVSVPLAAPRIETTEKALVVRWTPPTETITGTPVTNLVGYRIYGSPTGAAGSFKLLGESHSTEYRDRDFKFGQHYYFIVRAAFSTDGAMAESQPSPPVEVTPRDTFPPDVPRGLTAIQTQAGVELVWKPDDAPDLAGYKVYRRADSNPFELLTPSPVQTPAYRDALAKPGANYSYAVTAVDLSGNESRKSKPAAIHVR